MSFAWLSAAQRAAVDRALTTAFGHAPIEDVTLVSGGASGALPFRFEVRGRAYLIRVEGDPSPLRNPHQYAAMGIAAVAGIAPQTHYVDEDGRVAVMDFIAARPLETFPGGKIGLACALGDLLRRVQATARFPRFVDYPDIVARLWAHVCRTGLFAPGVLDVYSAHLARVRERYMWGPAN